MRAKFAWITFLVLASAAPIAQIRTPDLSGRWQLIEPTAAERALDTLTIDAPNQLLIAQTPLAIIVQHPSRPGTYPEAGTYEFGTRGFVGNSGRTAPLRATWDVSFIGTQIMISRSATLPPDERGVAITVARGSMWRLESPDRLIVEFAEERSGERPKIAIRSYVKVPGP